MSRPEAARRAFAAAPSGRRRDFLFRNLCAGMLVACNAEIGSRCPRDAERAAALQMLAMPWGIAVLCALHRTPSRTVLASHFNVTGH
jgi:hypothetical protein